MRNSENYSGLHRKEKVTLAMISREEISDEDLARLGATTMGERTVIRRICREASRKYFISELYIYFHILLTYISYQFFSFLLTLIIFNFSYFYN